MVREDLVEKMTFDRKLKEVREQGMHLSGEVASWVWCGHMAMSSCMFFPGPGETVSSLLCLVTAFGAKVTDDLLCKVPYFSQASLNPFWKHRWP